MSAISRATPLPISWHATGVCAATMFCTRWDGMPLAYPQNSTLSKPALTRELLPLKTFRTSGGRFRLWDLATIGPGKLILPTRTTSDGHSGSF